MLKLYISIIFIILNCKKGLSNQDIVMNVSHTIPVKLGDTVTITCKLSDPKSGTNIFLFKRKVTMISENCKVFEKYLYDLKCGKNDEYQLVIKSMSWNDKGEWFCLYASIVKSISLKIYVAPKISIMMQPIPKQISSKNLGPDYLPLNHLRYPMINGRGTQLYPFDIRNGLSVNLICKSECGYPTMNHVYNFRNSSNFSLQLNQNSFSYEKKECENSKDRKMFSAISNLELNCSSWKLYGLLNLTCSAIDPGHEIDGSAMVISQESIFILCPTEPIEWWRMTYIEKIFLGIGCFIALMLILYLFLLVCRWRSNKYNGIEDPCHRILASGNNDSATYKTRGYRV